MSLVASVLTIAAVLLLRPPGAWLTRFRLVLRPLRAVQPASFVTPVGVVAGVCVLMAGLPLARLIAAITAGGVAWFAVRQVRAERVRRRARAEREAVAEALGLMAAELRAGILPQRVLSGLSTDFPFLASASRAAGLGGDVSSALRRESMSAGRELLAEVASAWMVAERAGAPLAHALDRLDASARDDSEI